MHSLTPFQAGSQFSTCVTMAKDRGSLELPNRISSSSYTSPRLIPIQPCTTDSHILGPQLKTTLSLEILSILHLSSIIQPYNI
jgi:hypothetical protein